MHLTFNNLINTFQGSNSKYCSNILAAILEKWLPRPSGAKSVVVKYPDLFIMSFYKCAKFGAFMTNAIAMNTKNVRGEIRTGSSTAVERTKHQTTAI